MFAVVRHYHFKPEDGDKIDKLVREGFVLLIKKAKGFVRYYWLDTGLGEGAYAGAHWSVRWRQIHAAADHRRVGISRCRRSANQR